MKLSLKIARLVSLKTTLKYFFIASILLLNFNFFGQNIDSLKVALKNAKHDTTRLEIIIEKAEAEQNMRLVFWDSLWLELKKTGNKRLEPIVLNNIGHVYIAQGNIPRALDYLHKSLSICEKGGDKNGIVKILINIAYSYKSQNDYEKALEYFSRSLKISEKIKDKGSASHCLTDIGVTYYDLNNLPKAIEFLNKSLIISEETGDKIEKARILNSLGAVYELQGDISKSIDYLEKGLKIGQEIGDEFQLTSSYLNLAISNINGNRIEQALFYANKAMKNATRLGYPHQIKYSASILKEIFSRKNKYKEAFEMYELEIKMRDSINNEETQKAAVKKQLQYSYEKKEAVAKKEHEKELEKQQAIADEKQRKQAIVIWSVAIGLILVIAFAGYVFKTLSVTRKQKLLIEIKSREVEEKQKEILDSIHYAKRIQTALIPTDKYIDKNLNRLQNKG